MLKDNLIEVEEHIKKACEKSGRAAPNTFSRERPRRENVFLIYGAIARYGPAS